MKRNYGHTPKSKPERSAYTQYIKKQKYEPTTDEALEFEESVDKNQDLSVATSRKTRKRPIGNVLKDHFEENWPNWLVGGLTFVLLFVMVDSKIDIARIFEKFDFVNTNLERIEENQTDLKESIHNQDLQIQENKLKIEHLEKDGLKTKEHAPNSDANKSGDK